MIAELGQVLLIAALLISLILGTLPLIGAHKQNKALMQVGTKASLVQLALIAGAFGILTWAFVVQDFSVEYVARNSNSRLPMEYRFSAVWAAHEGSLVLWELILSGWTAAVALYSRRLPDPFRARVLAVLGLVSAGFLLFIIFTSNPFIRIMPAAVEGLDLNPLLQDPGLIIHPPMLYMGYVGFSVSFAFAIAALLGQQVNRDWVRWSRPWTHIAWAFLTIGIALGSWWAYYELGWGGWWFWDPVENASFMPWLAGTALIHSLAATEKRGLFKSWTVLLAIFAFSLSLLGTFLVRSGVLTSVHAFATDPERGLFILVFLAVVVGGSLTLYAFRAPAVSSRIGFAWVSRESLILINNVVFLVATLTVLFGTLFPLIVDALGQGKVSVGPPYFNAVFVPLMALLVPFMGLGPVSHWKRDKLSRWRAELIIPAVVAVLCAVTLPWLNASYNIWMALAVLLSAWLVMGLIRDFWQRLGRASSTAHGLRRLTPGYCGMLVAHFGFAVSVIGVVAVSQYAVERDLKMDPGDSVALAGYEFRFIEVVSVRGPNFIADEARFEVTRDGEPVASMRPQKRRYLASGSVMTEAAIDAGFLRDLYVAMGEPVGNEGAWAMRLHYKPLIRWMWLGAIFMAAGAITATLDKRYRRQRAVLGAEAVLHGA